MKAMILCAGLGTRFRPHTEKLAKPAIPFIGVPLFGFSLYYLEKIGLTELTVNTHHLPETLESSVSCMTQDQDYTITFLNEKPILGSGGGIKNAKDHLIGDEPFIVINGDEVLLHASPTFLDEMIVAHNESGALCTMLTIPHPEAGKAYPALQINEENQVTAISVKADSENLVHNCGVYIYSPRVFDYMPNKPNQHIFKDCLIPALEKGEKIMSFGGPKDLLWLDMSSEENYLECTKTALSLLQEPGPTSETLKDILNRFHQKIETELTEDAVIVKAQGAQLHDASNVKGFAVLGAGAIFTQGSIENAVIAPNIHIHELVSLKNQLVI